MAYPVADYAVRQGDTAPRITGTLQDGNGDPVNITNATVTLRMHGLTVSNDMELDASVEDGAAGTVYYDWDPMDVEAPGFYATEWMITFQAGQVQTFPNDSYFLVEIVELPN